MCDGIFGNLFDLNGDGELDICERALDYLAFEENMKELGDSDFGNNPDDDFDNDLDDDLDIDLDDDSDDDFEDSLGDDFEDNSDDFDF